MESCPNIGGREVKMRQTFTLFGLFVMISLIIILVLFDLQSYKLLIFFPAFGTGVVLFETLENTCIVYSYMGLKNMGLKYEKEKDYSLLKTQRLNSIRIILKALLGACVVTGIVYFLLI